MCIQEKSVDVLCNPKLYNMCQNTSVNHADNGKAEVISGQGRIRPSYQIRTQNKLNYVSNNPKKGGVMLGQDNETKVVVSGRVFYNKKQTPAQIESLLVRPLGHSITIFQSNAQKSVARSYASVVKGHTKERLHNHKYCKGAFFGLQKRVNKTQQGMVTHDTVTYQYKAIH